MTHKQDCPLSQPCRADSSGEHIMQGTVAGIPVTICGLCLNDCICERLRAHGKRAVEEYRANLNPEGLHLARQIMAILVNEGADSEQGWHSWRCFDKDRYPGNCGCTKDVAKLIVIDVIVEALASERKRVLTEAREALVAAMWYESGLRRDALAAIDRLIEQEES